MKIGSPIDTNFLSINARLRVLEVGPDSNPTNRANINVKKSVSDNKHINKVFRIAR